MKKKFLAGAMLTVGLFHAVPAAADENLFGYTYGAETLPKGESEAYLWITDRRNKAQGHYDAQDYQLEFEHGLTDHLQGSIYLPFRSHNIRGAAPIENGVPEYPDVNRDFGSDGVKASLKWNILSPFKDPIGLAVYVEPVWSRIHKVTGERQTELALETKLILQKNFLEDRLVWAFNWTLEQEFRKNKGQQDWGSELEWEFTSGLSYRFASNWYAGVEGRYHSEYPDFPAAFTREHHAWFAGPTLHYGGRKWWATLTYLPQIKGAPIDPSRSDTLHLGEHEKREVRLKIGYNF
jgi:hypothetical protein